VQSSGGAAIVEASHSFKGWVQMSEDPRYSNCDANITFHLTDITFNACHIASSISSFNLVDITQKSDETGIDLCENLITLQDV
jgi:hypothetical protein